MPNPIGVTFIPSEQNQLANGLRQAGAEGDLGGPRASDLGTVFKILNLRLPQVLGAQSPVSRTLLTSPGARGAQPFGTPPAMSTAPYDPMAAVFAALLRTMQSSGSSGGVPGYPVSSPDMLGPGSALAQYRGTPSVVLAAPPRDNPTSTGDAMGAGSSLPQASGGALGAGSALPQASWQSWTGGY